MVKSAIVSTVLFLAPCAFAAGPCPESEIPWDTKALSRVPKTYPADCCEKEGVTAIFYDGLPYQGAPTRVFAYYGVPEVEKGRKIPAVVCVHGGGGTAFDEWVRKWNERGYAAIAMDLEGHLPIGRNPDRPGHDHSGPSRAGLWSDIAEPVEDQWMYHAVADVMLAHSLIASFPDVDAERIGFTGISWGGIISSIVMGVDERFRFAIPVYGCGYLFEAETNYQAAYERMTPAHAKLCAMFWDGAGHLHRAAMPQLWINGTNDKHFPPPAWRKSYAATPGASTVCMKVRMRHGHQPGWESEEIYAFADSVVKGGKPLATVTDQGRTDGAVWVSYTSPVPVSQASLVTTKDSGPWPAREWLEQAAKLDPAANTATAPLPQGTTAYYLNLVDERNLIVSSPHEVVE